MDQVVHTIFIFLPLYSKLVLATPSGENNATKMTTKSGLKLTQEFKIKPYYWNGMENTKNKWFLFFIKVLTNFIYHKQKPTTIIHKYFGNKIRSKEWTEEQVIITKSGDYCIIFYINQTVGSEKENKVKWTAPIKGCPSFIWSICKTV